MPLVGRRPAQPSQPRRFLVLHPLEHVRDHQNPLAHTPAFPSCQAPQLRRPRVAAKKGYRHCPIPQTWYARLNTLPHLGITGSRYYTTAKAKNGTSVNSPTFQSDVLKKDSDGEWKLEAHSAWRAAQ